jgi:hypothetical protein
MQYIEAIDNSPNQKHTVLLSDNTPIEITLRYDDQNLGWFMDLYYQSKEFRLYNYRIVTGNNILRQFKRLIPFGILVSCDDLQEPLFIQDFLSTRAKFNIIDQDEIDELELFYETV